MINVTNTIRFKDYSLDVLEIEIENKFKYVICGDTISKIHNIPTKEVNQLINRNLQKFSNLELINICAEKYIEKAKSLKLIKSNGQKYCYLLTIEGYYILVDNIKNKDSLACEYILKNYFNQNSDILVAIPRKELIFGEYLSETLKVFNIDIISQFNVNGFRLDFYIPKLNIAIEYDENDHSSYTYEKHELRQSLIEKYLKCKFIRVSDKYSIGKAVGLVLKELNQSVFNLP